MGVRLLSSIFGKNPSPSPTSEVMSSSPPQPQLPAKSPIAKTRVGSTSKEPEAAAESPDEPVVAKRSVIPTKLGIGVGGNVLAEMKARPERRISRITEKNSEDLDISERSESVNSNNSKASSLSPNPLGGIQLRSTPPTPEELEMPKLSTENKDKVTTPSPAMRFMRSNPTAEKQISNPLSDYIRLRLKGGSDETEAPSTVKNVEDKSNILSQFRLRAASSTTSTTPNATNEDLSPIERNPLSGVKLRSTKIKVTDPLKSPNNGGGSSSSEDFKSESHNFISKLEPSLLAPKSRPWSIVGSDGKNGKNYFF